MFPSEIYWKKYLWRNILKRWDAITTSLFNYSKSLDLYSHQNRNLLDHNVENWKEWIFAKLCPSPGKIKAHRSRLTAHQIWKAMQLWNLFKIIFFEKMLWFWLQALFTFLLAGDNYSNVQLMLCCVWMALYMCDSYYNIKWCTWRLNF